MVTPDELLGRVNASWRVLVGGVIPFGAMIGGVLGGDNRIAIDARLLGPSLNLSRLFSICVRPATARHGLSERDQINRL